MSTDQPPPGQPPEDDPFLKKPQGGSPPPPQGGGSPYDSAPPPPPPPPPGGGDPYGGSTPPPPYDPNAYGSGSAYGGDQPLAGMPPLAPSGKRVLARIIDILIVAVVVWLVSLIFGGLRYNTDHMNYGRSLGQSVIAAILYIGYDTLMTVKRNGQTVGKGLFRLRAANLNDGTTPTTQAALVRAAVLWLPAVFCCACVWTAICGGWSFFDRPYKQGLHDKAAKTVVVVVTTP
ncbi:RDD family protein [Streptomyces sp. NPDC090052]|uniref:RDD family protein n=1 Tax=unclassified Streptomyces TaxID=2593676 RepID=UPI00224CF524|nr:RDD family protein [Streptomyces sp. NBC_01306]MCX4726321.1 RDD family protein [Streptomyces sp. NBC_01306]WSV04345.1 RDD family protein [Streptomyces sp. NBC_01020]WSX42416.1 RDD family protein [Streptomyces sp. NBC_00963]WSX69542.1 RDD family protein [Streptomyces sp. NBC_00932]